MTLTELAFTFPWRAINYKMLSAGFWRLLCLTDVLCSTFQSFLLRGTITATTKTLCTGGMGRAPTSPLPEQTHLVTATDQDTLASHPRSESCRARAKARESEIRVLFLQRHWQHYLAGIKELANLFLASTTAALAQPTAFAQSALLDTKP